MSILKLTKSPILRQKSRVILTGASSGIGRQLALKYASRGYHLVLIGRREDELKTVAEECLAKGAGEAVIGVADVSIQVDCKRVIEEAVRVLGGLDLLVLCAGIAAHILFSNVESLDIYEKLMQTNYFGYVYCTFYAFPHLRKAHGQILVVSSISGEIGLPYRSAYCGSKFAVTGFFESLRSEIDHNEIAITIVCPPSVKTNLRANSLVGTGTESSTQISVEKCVDDILAAADRRARKIYFPLKVYIAAYFRPFFPDLVDARLKKAAKL